MALPRTPQKTGRELQHLVDSLNDRFFLDLPNPLFSSPSMTEGKEKPPGLICYLGIKRLFYNRNVDHLHRVLDNFEEWAISRRNERQRGRGMRQQQQQQKSNGDRLMRPSRDDQDAHIRYLKKLIDDEIWLLNNGAFSPLAEDVESQGRRLAEQLLPRPPSKRRLSSDNEDEDEDEDGESSDFHTAPSSPVKHSCSPIRTLDFTRTAPAAIADEFLDSDLEEGNWNLNNGRTGQATQNDTLAVSTAPRQNPTRQTSTVSVGAGPTFWSEAGPSGRTSLLKKSFSTVATSFMSDTDTIPMNTSFANTTITEPDAGGDDDETDSQSVYEYLLASHAMELFDGVNGVNGMNPKGARMVAEANSIIDQKILDRLLTYGPFSVEQSFPRSIPLRHRYELERIGRAWKVPLKEMLVGDTISFQSHEDFWKWIERHSRRGNAGLPEKSSRKAWDAAVEQFKTDKHSEVVVLTGDLDWCSPSEPGILKLRLNPLRTERTCRFRRRFGADRFMSLTIPAPSRPPNHLRIESHPTLLRESIASWLTQNVHSCLGRKWRPFYVEEVKLKRKSNKGFAEPRFRVDFFAVDGVDFDQYSLRPMPAISPARQDCDRHTPMSLEALVNWHMPPEANRNQSNCKLFQRFSLGLSKTYATVVLKPAQILHLKDLPGRPVMNDGCALMSRSVANAICDHLGMTGNTPSCFQGRIAGAKGLWMVDRHESPLAGEDNDPFWIQITDSQLKIKPHPRDWTGPLDDEQLTFEVLNWSKPLHPVDLNVQLLAILEHGGPMKEYIAELTRRGIRELYQDFAAVLQADSSVLCRGLVQKLRPPGPDGAMMMAMRIKRLEQWMMDDAEYIIRLSEAGFSPRCFLPLRKRLRRFLQEALDRHVDELHIEVPLSTYAYCIADPYGVLQEDEVHFEFSSQWQDPHGQFEDNLLDGVDVLVGRLPAHLPSDIQRRRAVWKPELRHFKDVIVFPTKGNTPLAHLLSGGDYDGDTPWICWDQNIVSQFANCKPPPEEEEYGSQHFGLTNHSIPMDQIPSMDEFLRGTFAFNLTLSNLGRCTVEHEKLKYDESIDHSKAKELACLLSHLVDGRKGGVHLSEQAWKEYRRTISPRMREAPAYKNPERRPKMSNIIDYLKFRVARTERDAVLKQLNDAFPEKDIVHHKDEDLLRPYQEAIAMADEDRRHGGRLHDLLKEIAREIQKQQRAWTATFQGESKEYSSKAEQAVERVRAINPPPGDHPLCHTWQQSPAEWLKHLASATYARHWRSSFPFHAFGETLCQIKASQAPSRSVRNEILACYKVSQRMVQHLTATDQLEETPGGSDADDQVYEGEDAIEAMLVAGYEVGEEFDFDDGKSVE
ncbi:hypothetical protein ASPZODRAFT_62883 [Penicilliopsis zonata CBS 506.65]|uniref:RNA-dependent RNA polymerase n=1 Tax=Penicilliopsis zonata CBS 506.65 TaxID=1073090 RepID=A0A1L9SMC6_9EURO|nr:hypothetical protein ASPZODRAFT_62883 [Penicilliopsis zonata CBS 506.65]OJJ48422.1 hypothetical protein ASPZODRAFT_62883 [Penicilliopsis zonata CBS 506.65]